MTAETRIFMGNHICLPSVGMSKSASRHDRQASKPPPPSTPPKVGKASGREDGYTTLQRETRQVHARRTPHKWTGHSTPRRPRSLTIEAEKRIAYTDVDGAGVGRGTRNEEVGLTHW